MRRTVQFYARLAALLPRDVAAEYGADMAATFERRSAERRRLGRLRFLAFAVREFGGLLRVVVTERAVLSPTGAAAARRERKAARGWTIC